MQWLIDIVVEAVIAEIGIPPTFIDRGDPAIHDFGREDLNIDFNWHDLNLSTIVPKEAKAVTLFTYIIALEPGSNIWFRKKSNTHTQNISRTETQIDGRGISSDHIIACDENQIIQYRIAAATWSTLTITVKGWWL